MSRSFRTMFPSKYLKADDLNGRAVVGTIRAVEFESIGQGDQKDMKGVLHFEESHLKNLVLNLINSETIAEIIGADDLDAWPGHAIELYPTRTEFAGKRVPCVRVRAPRTRPAAAASATVARDETDDAMPTVIDGV